MQTKFEHFAATSMLGSKESPPRNNGALRFDREWERRAFGMAVALSKEGHYEWEDFRQGLIASIAEWEAENAQDDPSWDYSAMASSIGALGAGVQYRECRRAAGQVRRAAEQVAGMRVENWKPLPFR